MDRDGLPEMTPTLLIHRQGKIAFTHAGLMDKDAF